MDDRMDIETIVDMASSVKKWRAEARGDSTGSELRYIGLAKDGTEVSLCHSKPHGPYCQISSKDSMRHDIALYDMTPTEGVYHVTADRDGKLYDRYILLTNPCWKMVDSLFRKIRRENE